MDAKTVKMDLKRIKYGKKNIAVLVSELEKRRSHLVYLKACRPSKENRVQIEIIEKSIAIRITEIERKLDEVERLRKNYDAAIDSLSDIDKVIVTQGYIEGMPYKMLGAKLGYSERGIQERMVRIIDEMAYVMTKNN